MPPDPTRMLRSARWLVWFVLALAACGPRFTPPLEPPSSVRRGDQAFRYQEYDAAIHAYRTYLDQTEAGEYTARVAYKTALAQYRLKRYSDTLATLDELAQRYPKGRWVQVDALRGDTERALGHPLTALQAWDSAWEIANDQERLKLRQRIVVVAHGLSDTELARARRLVNSEDVGNLLDRQIALRQPPSIGEPIPETGEEGRDEVAEETRPEAMHAAGVAEEPDAIEPPPKPVAKRADRDLEGHAAASDTTQPRPPAQALPRRAPVALAPPAPAPDTAESDLWHEPGPSRKLAPPEPEPAPELAKEAPERVETESLPGEAPPPAEPAALEAPATQPIPQGASKVGCLLPLTGTDREFGERSLRGLRLVFGEDSDRLVVKDVGGDPTAATTALNELARDPRVLIVVGPLRSDAAEAVARRAEQVQLPLLLLSQREGLSGRFALQVGMTRSRLVGGLLDYAMGKARLRRFGVLYPGNAYGKELLSAFRAEVDRRGGTLVGADAYRPDTKAVAVGTVRRWRDNQNMQALFVPDSAMAAGRFAKALQQEMPDVTLLGVLGGEALSNYSDGTAVSGVLFSDAFYADSARPATRKFVLRFEQAYGEPPGVPEAQAYDAALLAKHVLDAGAGSRGEVLRQLHGLSIVAGATGDLRITSTGFGRSPFLLQVYDGKLEEIGGAG